MHLVTDNSSSNLPEALQLAELGYKIVPIPPGEKYPKGLGAWQERATDDITTVTEWWEANPQAGIGWAMGRQPNGMNLAAIDVDVVDGKQGKETLTALARELDFFELLQHTVSSKTGSGGRHFIVEVDDAEVTNGRLGPGLDLRGEGGFIVVPPSIHPNGERYIWYKDRSPRKIEPAPAPRRLIEFLAGGYQTATGSRPVGQDPVIQGESQSTNEPGENRLGSDPTPADWARSTRPIGEALTEAGWTYMESKGDDHYWCRPDKNPRDGHSAILHGDAPLVVWSTTVDASFWRVGRDNHDGSKSLSPLDVYAAIHHDGDIAAASGALRREMPRVESRTTEAAGAHVDPQTPGAMDLNLPDEFWESKPWLSHVREAAWSRLVSPDATLIALLARYATLIPPTLRLPGIVGSDATFDFIGCTVASSSGGKTVANGVAAELLPVSRKDLMLNLPVGSGEGLIQSFFVPEVDDEGKRTGKQVVGMTGGNFMADEGTALMEQNARKGTTIVQTFCSAWSGATLGQANASAETRRIIEARRVRITAMLNIQTANGHLLLDDGMVAIGLPQRVVFCWAHDSSLPDPTDMPSWPGTLDLPVPPTILGTIQHMDVDDEIVQEVRQTRWEVATGRRVLAPLDGHLGLSQLKVSGILALMDGSIEIRPEDWALASQIMDSSIAVRRHLIAVKIEHDSHRRTSQAAARVDSTLKEMDLMDAQLVSRTEMAVMRHLSNSPGGLTKREIKDKLSKPQRRSDVLWTAVDNLLAKGDIERVERPGQGEAMVLYRVPPL